MLDAVLDAISSIRFGFTGPHFFPGGGPWDCLLPGAPPLEDGIFQPYINNEHIDRLVRKTEAFSFQMHAFEGQQAIISQYAESLFEEDNSAEFQ